MLAESDIHKAKTADLVRLVEDDLGPGKRSGRWVLFKCPFHGDHDPSLGVTNGDPERPAYWRCFGCGKSGDAVAWLIEYRQMSFPEAVSALLSGNSSSAGGRMETAQEPILPPGDRWQKRAGQVIKRAEECLWDPVLANENIRWPAIDRETGQVTHCDASALDWLLTRGLTEQTMRKWHIGYIPKTWRDKAANWGLSGEDVWIPQGILIPCTAAERIWYLKIRRPDLKPKKYGQVRGGRPAIYLVRELNREAAVLCEGELDALLLWQEAGDLAGIGTLGSASAGLDLATWGLYLLKVKRWFLAYDLDISGEQAADRLHWLSGAQRAAVPQLGPGDKDLTDYFQSGGDLRAWLAAELQGAF